MNDSMVGQAVPDIRLERFEGPPTALSDWRGKRVALFCFSTWALGRGQLPDWQELSARLPADALVAGVAAEVEGGRWLHGYMRQYKVKFPVLLDRKNLVGGAFGYKAGPNLILIDESGRLVQRRMYDASLRKTDCRGDVEGFLLRGTRPAAVAPDPNLAPKPGSQEAFAKAVDLFLAGDLKACRGPWTTSVRFDPEHWISQEQIWVLDAPERFHPWIDVAWQNEQLAAEGRPVCACEAEV
jgi:peroxiredoxin